MTTKEKALALHTEGFNCAQSVLAACAEYVGIDEKQALAISGPFGGGMRCGEMCGAVSGGLMAVGLCCPFDDADNAEAKAKIAMLAKQFTGEFKENMGNLRCLDLKKDGVPCDKLIAYAAELTEKIINLNK